MHLEEHVPLASLSTFGVGGYGRYLARASTAQELREVLEWAQKQHLPSVVIGHGSNILFSDTGFDGAVIKIEIAGIEIQKDSTKALLIAGAGESWDEVVARAVAEGLWGLENLSGIPGTVGGAVVGNIGAYGAAVSEVLAWVEAYDTRAGNTLRLSARDCAFEYRDSIFKRENHFVVLRAAFVLSAEPAPNLSYKDLAERFGAAAQLGAASATHEAPSLAALRGAVLEIRRAKFPDLAIEGTAGSFFKNPVISRAAAQQLQQKYPEMPLFSLPETDGVKIPLAWFLDRVLGLKGFAMGGARLFEKQPLVIVARRDASAADVIALKGLVEEKFFAETKIKIEPEVKIIF